MRKKGPVGVNCYFPGYSVILADMANTFTVGLPYYEASSNRIWVIFYAAASGWAFCWRYSHEGSYRCGSSKMVVTVISRTSSREYFRDAKIMQIFATAQAQRLVIANDVLSHIRLLSKRGGTKNGLGKKRLRK